MNCLVFALTGMGNYVVSALATSPYIKNVFLVTREEKGAFPYFPCEDITLTARNLEISCIFTQPWQVIAAKAQAALSQIDFVITATFHKIVPPSILEMANVASFNIHPSLLPAYKGPSPTNWQILHRESQTGITVHELTSKIDEGSVFLQKAITMNPSWTDGQLRHQLAQLAGDSIDELIHNFTNDLIKPFSLDNSAGLYYPRITSQEAIQIIQKMDTDPATLSRAITPFPGLEFLNNYGI